MFCQACGSQMPDNAVFCNNCGAAVGQSGAPNMQMSAPTMQINAPAGQMGQMGQMGGMPMTNPYAQAYTVPKCTCCGYVGDFNVGPLIKKSDWIIFFILLFVFGSGFIYLTITIISRYNKENREKICPNCKSQNMFTFVY